MNATRDEGGSDARGDDPHCADTAPVAAAEPGEARGLSVVPELPGRYSPGEVLGEGAFGKVVLVRDEHLGRSVARKTLSVGGAAAARFLREARVTAQLEHPGIVSVHELGRGADGSLYYTMRAVRGRTLSAAIAAAPDLAARLRLVDHVIAAANAIAYAHSRGVIHRDLKPGNVMIGPFGETVVLDWGLARVGDEPEPAGDDPIRPGRSAAETQAGVALGTPAYMSPEQARGEAVDARTDVWALGAMLHEVITGAAPFAGSSPMAILSAVLTVAPTRVRGLCPEAPPELDAITHRALTSPIEGRYQSAAAFAADLAAWRRGDVVSAHRYGAVERAGRAARRHRRLLAAGLAALASLAVSGLAFSVRLRRERDRALTGEADARGRLRAALTERARRGVTDGDRVAALAYGAAALQLADDPDARGAVVAAASARVGALRWARRVEGGCRRAAWRGDRVACATPTDLYVWDAAGALVLHVAGVTRDGGGMGALAWSPDGARVALGVQNGVRLVAIAGAPRDLAAPAQRVMALAWVDGRRIAVAGSTGRSFVLDAASGAVVAEGPAAPTTVRSIAATPDGALVAVGSNDHQVRLWRAADGSLVRLLDAQEGAYDLAFSPDGARLAAVGDVVGGTGHVRVWDVATGAPRAGFAPVRDELRAVGWTPDGRALVTGDDGGAVRVWELATDAERAHVRLPGGPQRAVAVGGDGRWLFTCALDGSVRVWDFGGGAAGRVSEPETVGSVAWSSDGARLAYGTDAGELVIRERGGAARGRWAAAPRALWGLQWIDDRRLGGVAADSAYLELDAATGAVRPMRGSEGARFSYDVDRGADGRVLAVFGDPARRVEYEALIAQDGAALQRVRWPLRGLRAAVWDAAPGHALVVDGDGRLWRARVDGEGTPTRLGDPAGGYVRAARTADGAVLATGERELHWIDAATGAVRARLTGAARPIDAATSAAGRVAAGTSEGAILVWELPSGRLRARFDGHARRVWSVALSPDGRWLASGSADRTFAQWDLGPVASDARSIARRAERETGLVVGPSLELVDRSPSASQQGPVP